ncbi:MAG: hypothetical protein M3Q45_15785 [Chloroflexota bacterium]|nr:hypothetical protein [Chloroflexota bacterium]
MNSDQTHSAHRQGLEWLFACAWLDRDVYHGSDELKVHWPADLAGLTPITVRVQTPTGRIYVESQPTIGANSVVNLGKVNQWPDGLYHLVLMPEVTAYYVQGLRVQRHLPLQVVNSPFADTPYGTFESRRHEALQAAARHEGTLFGEIAKLALGMVDSLNLAVIEAALDTIDRRAVSSDSDWLGLLGMMARYGDDLHFPTTLQTKWEACLLQAGDWLVTPDHATPDDEADMQAILGFAGAILTDQLYGIGESRLDQPDKGEQKALVWLRQRATGGFRPNDSRENLEKIVLALTHLADLAENNEVAEMAAVVLDKLFFMLAVNSYHGVAGFTQRNSAGVPFKSGRLMPAAGMMRLLWGMGAFNAHSMGTVGLACAKGYTLPAILAGIAADQQEELWSQQQYAESIHQAAYKTLDYLLCSVQGRQSCWQATFGPDALVFATDPAGAPPPKVAQWKDVLVAIYQQSGEDGQNSTQVYFPLAAFDETALQDGWAFARQGNGYLALTAAGGLQMTMQGDIAYRAVQSSGTNSVWFCHLGRVAQDGSFADFQACVLALDVTFEPAGVHADTLRNDSIDFRWTGPLLINEREAATGQSKQIENPYCVADAGAEQIDIHFQDQQLRLDFSVSA